MKLFVLVGMRDEILSCVKIFDTFEDALKEAKDLAKNWDVYPQFITQNHHASMDGWIIADVAAGRLRAYSEPIFIAIVTRPINHKQLPTHADISKQIQGTPAHVSALASTPVAPSNSDNPFDDNLPGGFSHDNKPLTIKEVKDDITNVKTTYDLNEEQKWALVTARVRKRPNFLIRPKIGLYSQVHALTELNKRTPVGSEIVSKELDVLQDFYSDLDSEYSSSSEDSWN